MKAAEKARFTEVLKQRIAYYRSCTINAGDKSDLVELGGKIAAVNLVITILEMEDWSDDDWQEWDMSEIQ